MGKQMVAFGPVPSRRLGKSLGINNIPPKNCSYSCVYCQLGRTTMMSVTRKAFGNPERIFLAVKGKVEQATARGEKIDYLTFVPDGEPTLDSNLGKEIELLKQIGIPVAVLTNASLLWREDVRLDLLKADLISLKVDSVSANLWRRVNRPHGSLKFSRVKEGMVNFSKEFKGTIITETMLIDGVDYANELEGIASTLAEVRTKRAYLAIPTKPPAEAWVKPAREEVINDAFQIFSKKLARDRVEYLTGYEGNAFASTGDIEEDLLSITSVHPMREDGVKELLRKANSEWSVVAKLLSEGKLVELEYEGHRYYVRRLPSRM